MSSYERPQGLVPGGSSGERPHAARRAIAPDTGPPTASELVRAIPGGLALAGIGFAAVVIGLSWPG